MNIRISPGNVHDSIPCISPPNCQQAIFGLPVKAVAPDLGSPSSSACQSLKELGVLGVIGHQLYPSHKGMIPKRKFKYHAERGCCICLCGQELQYRTTTREGPVPEQIHAYLSTNWKELRNLPKG